MGGEDNYRWRPLIFTGVSKFKSVFRAFRRGHLDLLLFYYCLFLKIQYQLDYFIIEPILAIVEVVTVGILTL